MAREGRSVLGMIFTNFINSIKAKNISGTIVGKDHFGNKYYEIPAAPEKGKRNPSRWFKSIGDECDPELPAEWEAWLRGRRQQAPTEQEIEKNIAVMKLTKQRSLELESQETKTEIPEAPEGQRKNFPFHPDYEQEPGKPVSQNYKRR